MDMWNAPMVQSRQPLTNRLMESVGLGGHRWHGSSWQRGIAESRSSWLSTLLIDIPGDLVWDLPYVHQASYLEGGPLMWMLPLYLHVNQKSVDHDDDDVNKQRNALIRMHRCRCWSRPALSANCIRALFLRYALYIIFKLWPFQHHLKRHFLLDVLTEIFCFDWPCPFFFFFLSETILSFLFLCFVLKYLL